MTDNAPPKMQFTDAHRQTAEQVWHDPDWDCPRCRSVNGGFRERCRICGFDSALVSNGICLEMAVADDRGAA